MDFEYHGIIDPEEPVDPARKHTTRDIRPLKSHAQRKIDYDPKYGIDGVNLSQVAFHPLVE